MKPIDPVQENQNALTGKPMKAFIHQDHTAHIQVHMLLLQDPMIQQFIGQNPQAPKIMGAITAHIAEHVGYQMRQKIEQQLGMPLPPEDTKLPPEIEIALSGMMAQAAQQVLQENQAQAAQAAAQQQALDPVIQMQQQELQIRAQEVALKAKKIAADAAGAADKLELEKEKVKGQLELESMRVGAQINESKAKQQFEQERSGVQLGAEIAKNQRQMDLQARTTAMQHATQNKQREPKK
jgi:hypothetical protein